MAVIPEQADEFTCRSCFLVRHRSQLVRQKNGTSYCTDCEGWNHSRRLGPLGVVMVQVPGA